MISKVLIFCALLSTAKYMQLPFSFHRRTFNHWWNGLYHSLLFFWKAKAIFASIDFETQWSIFFVRLYSGIYLKLFPGVCCNRWQGWTWIETWKSLANFFKFQHSCYSLNSMPEEVTNWKKMSWLVLPDEVVCYLHHNNNQLSLIKIPSKKLL